MNKNQTLMAIVGMMVGLLVGAYLIHAHNSLQHDRIADDKCWVSGGTYKDGTCTPAEPKGSSEARRCITLGGETYVADGRCYKSDGTLLYTETMPTLHPKR